MNSLQDVEKWLKRLFLAAMAGSAAWMSGLGCLLQLALIVSVVGIPLAIFLTASPTIFLYMLAGLPAWLLLRRVSGWAAAAAAVLVMLAGGIGLAEVGNRRLARSVAALTGGDRGRPLLLARGSRVALLDTWQGEDGPQCAEYCQRLLLSGTASLVMVGKPAALDGRTPLRAWFITPADARGCRPPALPNVRADERDLGADVPYVIRPVLSSRLSAVYGAGHCLATAPRPLAEADAVLIDEGPDDAAQPRAAFGVDWRLARILFLSRSRILLRQQGRLVEVVRNTRAIAYGLAAPLYLSPPTYDDAGTHEGHWGWRDVREFGDRTHAYASSYIRNDLSVGGLVGLRGVIYRPEAMAKPTPED